MLFMLFTLKTNSTYQSVQTLLEVCG